MKVRVTQLGYFNVRLAYPGEVIEVEPDQFSSNWMERVVEEKPAPKPEPAATEEPQEFDAQAPETAEPSEATEQVRRGPGRPRKVI